jgi:hypothetical protein
MTATLGGAAPGRSPIRSALFRGSRWGLGSSWRTSRWARVTTASVTRTMIGRLPDTIGIAAFAGDGKRVVCETKLPECGLHPPCGPTSGSRLLSRVSLCSRSMPPCRASAKERLRRDAMKERGPYRFNSARLPLTRKQWPARRPAPVRPQGVCGAERLLLQAIGR